MHNREESTLQKYYNKCKNCNKYFLNLQLKYIVDKNEIFTFCGVGYTILNFHLFVCLNHVQLYTLSRTRTKFTLVLIPSSVCIS